MLCSTFGVDFTLSPKGLWKTINGQYCFEQEIHIDLLSLDKNDTVKAMLNDIKRFDMINETMLNDTFIILYYWLLLTLDVKYKILIFKRRITWNGIALP